MTRISIDEMRRAVAGLDREVPLLDGKSHVYVNLDNAATTPPFYAVLRAVEDFAEWYSSVHRGAGFKSLLSTHVYERCRSVVAEFVGADLSHHAIIFTQNATDSLNKLCQRLILAPDEVILTTLMEHHSNLLPWRFRSARHCEGQLDYVRIVREDGSLDLDHLVECLRKHNGRVRLVTVTGASNVTGFLPPIHEFARLAHAYGAQILVDAAQLIAHRRISLGAPDDPERIDFLAFSGHKIYAPFGTGVLIGPKEFFETGIPSSVGGGTVEIVAPDDIEWADVPEKEEAGTPNLLGALALARAIELLSTIGMDAVEEHERELTSYALARLGEIDGISIYGDSDPRLPRPRVGVIPIIAEGVHHALLAAALGYEWGIGVRHGCFCAQPYVMSLLGLTAREVEALLERVRAGDRSGLPGFVRVSLALYNTLEEIDYLAQALKEIRAHGPRGRYVVNRATGEYRPENSPLDFSTYFPF
jgi:cysteine desulfurase/selenocysteine lyase